MLNDFLKFIDESKTEYHATKNIKEILKNDGFIELNEYKPFDIKPNGNYFITINNSSIIAFKIPSNLNNLSFNISAAHLDSPGFKLKPNPLIEKNGYYLLNTEPYGGVIYNSFLDRPLDIAGRIFINDNNKIKMRLFSFDRAVCQIPSQSIHYNRNVNEENKLNPQIDMLPILCKKDKDINFNDLIKEELNIDNDILGYDLYLSILDKSSLVGINNEFISAPKLDDLVSSYALTKALIKSSTKNINVLALFNNEEIGSSTMNGANSNMLNNILDRILDSLKIENKNIVYSKSFLVSADNAQGFHPSFGEKYDPTNRAILNQGLAIKVASNGSYTSDGYSISIFKKILDDNKIKYQYMTNRSDIKGGSTLGALLLRHLSIHSVDIGIPELAMHSSNELMGANDLSNFIDAMKAFYETKIDFIDDENIEIGD